MRTMSDISWSDVPYHIIQAELQRRQDAGEKPACGSRGPKGGYNTPIHVFALILILTLSTVACSFPIIARRFPNLSIPHRFLFLSRHFGTGVLIATAFVHLLPTAFNSLTDPCLPSFWNKGYTPMAGLVAMTSVFIVVGIEMFFATRGAGHIHGSEYDRIGDGDIKHNRTTSRESNGGRRRTMSLRRFQEAPDGLTIQQTAVPETARLGTVGNSQSAWSKVESDLELGSPLPPDVDTASPLHMSDMGDDSDIDIDAEELDPMRSDDREDLLRSGNQVNHSYDAPKSPRTASSPEAERALERKLMLQCLLLEAGILFHSVFIGIAVSVSTGPPFVVLLIAISFHQTFEGLALGSRIAAIPNLSPLSPKPWLMALAYGATTPIGQAIGLGVHGLYDPHGQTGLLMVGMMNAISSGLLLFAGLVELLAEDFLSDNSYETLRGRRRLEACAAVISGAFLMAGVGAFA